MYRDDDVLSNVKPTEKPRGADSVGGSESDDLRCMIESMRDEFTRKIDLLTHRAEHAEERAARAENELELTGLATSISKVTQRVPKGAVGGAQGGACPKSSFQFGPTGSESNLERDKAMSNVGQLTGGTIPPKTPYLPLTPLGSTSGPSGSRGTPSGNVGTRPSPGPKKGRRSAVSAFLGRFSEEDAVLFDAPEIS